MNKDHKKQGDRCAKARASQYENQALYSPSIKEFVRNAVFEEDDHEVGRMARGDENPKIIPDNVEKNIAARNFELVERDAAKERVGGYRRRTTLHGVSNATQPRSTKVASNKDIKKVSEAQKRIPAKFESESESSRLSLPTEEQKVSAINAAKSKPVSQSLAEEEKEEIEIEQEENRIPLTSLIRRFTVTRPGAVSVPGPDAHSDSSSSSHGRSSGAGLSQPVTPEYDESSEGGEALLSAVLVGSERNSNLPLAEAFPEKPWYRRRSPIIAFLLLVAAIIVAVVVPFTTTKISPTSSPTFSPAPSFSPTAAPTFIIAITVRILLDDFPADTGWSLECDNVELAKVPSSTYTLPGQTITETFEVTYGAQCVFKITDDFKDGICCAEGQGFYQVYFGDDPSIQRNLLVEGGEFGAEEVRSFTVIEPPTTISPAPTISLLPSTCPTTSVAPTQSLWFQLGQDLQGETPNAEAGISVSLSSNGGIVAIGQPGDGPGGVQVLQYDHESNIWKKLGQTIQGQDNGDEFGTSVSLSSDASILAIGGPFNSGNEKFNAGHVQVFQYDTLLMNWTKIGNISGGNAEDRFGSSVSLQSDGKTLACGAANQIGRSYARVYDHDGAGLWSQVGRDILAAVGDEHLSVSLSGDGMVLAVSSPLFNGENGVQSCQVRVFEQDANNTWVQLGQNLEGLADYNYFGRSISLSSNGGTLAIGSYLVPPSGLVRVYRFDVSISNWTQIGEDMVGKSAGDLFGNSVSLSNDGTILGIGSLTYGIDPQTPDVGYVGVYQYNAALMKWGQIAQDIDLAKAARFSVSLSDDGSIVAFGAPKFNRSGVVKVFTRDG